MRKMGHSATMNQRKKVNVVTPQSGKVGDGDPKLKASGRSMDHGHTNYGAGRREGGPFGK